jgi:hypothetical protein
VNGVLNEAGGKGRLDSSGASIVPGVGGPGFFFFERALLLTDATSANLTTGLKIVDTFNVRGRFDLAVPSVRLEHYGIRLNDGTLTNPIPNDLLQLTVRQTSTGLNLVQFFRLDIEADTFTSIAAALLNPNHDQIDLFLSRNSLLSNEIQASFAYVDGGVSGPVTTFGSTSNIFNGENFTRAEFLYAAPAPVPEPATLLLFGTTAAGLGLARWRRRRQNKSTAARQS